MSRLPGLPPPDCHHVDAASGWLDLGNPGEAEAELARVSEANRRHPAVLDLEWQIRAREGRWEEALGVARRLIEVLPDDPAGWIQQSFALHELRRTREAWGALSSVAQKHPGVSVIPYNLACYTCQLGWMREARRWLAAAMKMGGQEEIRRMALEDPDLEPLWRELRER
jgi:predicted Zn-dependent protease